MPISAGLIGIPVQAQRPCWPQPQLTPPTCSWKHHVAVVDAAASPLDSVSVALVCVHLVLQVLGRRRVEWTKPRPCALLQVQGSLESKCPMRQILGEVWLTPTRSLGVSSVLALSTQSLTPILWRVWITVEIPLGTMVL